MTSDTWTPVEPLTDDDLNQRYWREPKVGDRVRVRLSGECDTAGFAVGKGRGSLVWIEGHHEEEDGQTGNVIECPFIDRDGFCVEETHRIVVKFDEFLHDPRLQVSGGHYAASELEILP